MENMQELLARKNGLMAAMRMMDRNARFDTEEGRVYAHTLVKHVQAHINRHDALPHQFFRVELNRVNRSLIDPAPQLFKLFLVEVAVHRDIRNCILPVIVRHIRLAFNVDRFNQFDKLHLMCIQLVR